jgi:hypothetical protein
MLFEPEQACLHEVRSENVKNRQQTDTLSCASAVYSSVAPRQLSRCFVDFKMFSEQKLLCYNRACVEQYVKSENSEGKEIKIGFSAYF